MKLIFPKELKPRIEWIDSVRFRLLIFRGCRLMSFSVFNKNQTESAQDWVNSIPVKVKQ